MEDLDYTSSSPDFATRAPESHEDEADLSALVRVSKLLANRQAYYQSVDSLSLEDKNLTVEQQLAVNKQVLFHIQELEGLVEGAINNVKEQQRG